MKLSPELEKMMKEEKTGHVCLMLLPEDGSPIVLSEGVNRKMQKRIYRLIKDVVSSARGAN